LKDGPVFLLYVPQKTMLNEPGTMLLTDLFGPIGGIAVHHNNLICDPIQGIETSSDIPFLIESDDNG
jgi:hypothetical protein